MFLHRGLPAASHPITGAPIVPLGVTKNGKLIWPVMGGSQPSGEPAPQPGPPSAAASPTAPPGPAPQPNPLNPPHGPGNPQTPVFPPQVNEHGYPENTPLAAMTPEQQVAYWRTYARRNEDRIKQMGDYGQLKEQADAYQKLLSETQTEQQKAVTAAEQRGRATALAEAGSQMVEAYVRAAASGRMSEEQVGTLLQGLDRTRFVNPSSGQVDAQMIGAYISLLAPQTAWGAPAYAPPMTPPMAPPMAVPQAGAMPPRAGMPGAYPNVAPQLTYPPQQQPQYAGVPQQAGQPWGTYPPQPQQQQQQPTGQQPAMGDRQVPSYGQAQYPNAPASGLEAGKAIARARFGKPA